MTIAQLGVVICYLHYVSRAGVGPLSFVRIKASG